MAIRLIIGHTGVGKTQKIMDEIVEVSTDSAIQPSIVLIVPEQATLAYQHALIQEQATHCLTNIEVLSFQRLSHRLRDILGVAGKTILSDVGKNMLIRKIIHEDKEGYPFLSKHIHKRGYLRTLKELMSEFSRYAIDTEDFSKMAHLPETSLLKFKLADCQRLYTAYKKQIEATYISGDSLMTLLAKNCHKSHWLKTTQIIIDGFYGFTPIQYQLIGRFMEIAESVTLTLTVSPEILKEKELEKHHLFYEGYITYHQIKKLIKENGKEVVEEILKEKEPTTPLEALRDNLYQYPYTIYLKNSDLVTVALAFSRKKEVAHISDRIMYLVREEGYQYKDIAILLSDISHYEQLIKRRFHQVGIPFYMDRKQLVVANETVRFLLSCVKIMVQQMSYESMFAYLRSGYVAIDATLLDHLENYVIRYGIRGMKKWEETWDYVAPDLHLKKESSGMVAHLEVLNTLRASIVEPIKAYRDKKATSIKEHIKNLYELLLVHRFEEQISEKATKYMGIGDYHQGRVYQQLYPVMMDLLDQLNEIGLDEQINYKEFYQLLETGFEALEVSSVPARMDEVLVGDLTRSKLFRRSSIFVLGVNEGVVPLIREATGLLTDRERGKMEAKEFHLAPSMQKLLYREHFYIYMGLLKAKEYLYLSYVQTDEAGKAMRPSHLIHMIRKILPKHLFIDTGDQEKEILFYHPEVAYEMVMHQLQMGKDMSDTSVYQWLNNNKVYGQRMKKALQARQHNEQEEKLSPSISQALYGENLNNSVSRLEKFAQCPFAHFVSYGLKAKEQEIYEVTMPQLGLIFHKVIELFSKRIRREGMVWSEITASLRQAWVTTLVDEVLMATSHTVFFDSARNKAYIQRIKKITDQAIWAIGVQMGQGTFEQVAIEESFNGREQAIDALMIPLSNHKRMVLQGKIDRIDVYETEKIAYTTIIDYKSSNKKLNLEDIYYGLQLQLVVYLDVAVKIMGEVRKKEVVPAGIFYFKIDDPYIKETEIKESGIIKDGLLEKFKLDGLVLDNKEAIEHLDQYFLDASMVIPVKKNKDGTFSKHSKIIEKEAFDTLRTFVGKTIQGIGNQIVTGEIQPEPFKYKEQTACTNCVYKSICGFDTQIPTCHYRVLKNMKKEAIFASMEEEKNQKKIEGIF